MKIFEINFRQNYKLIIISNIAYWIHFVAHKNKNVSFSKLRRKKKMKSCYIQYSF